MKIAIVLTGVLVVAAAGCAGRPSLFPNSDSNLRRTSAQFAADAAKRHPYHEDVPHAGNALASAEYDLTFATVSVLNYSDEDWRDVEVWVNRNYVCYVPLMEKGKERVKTLNFQMLYDADGNYFWTDGGKTPLQTVEIVHDGKLYNVPMKQGL